MTASRTIRLSPEDNVVVAVDQIVPGTTVAGVSARERVMRGHKMAIAAIKEGEPIRKYGQIIGFYCAGRLGARAQYGAARFCARLPFRRGCEER
jgi:hypothetical protein